MTVAGTVHCEQFSQQLSMLLWPELRGREGDVAVDRRRWLGRRKGKHRLEISFGCLAAAIRVADFVKMTS